MLGLLTADSGSIKLFEESIESFNDGERISYVPQQSTRKSSTMPATVREVVTMGRFADIDYSRLSKKDRNAVDEALEKVGIQSLASRRVNQLSGGQRQRASIARALATDPELLALDEPAVGVDAESRDSFYNLLNELNVQGITIILIEHDIGIVTDHANRIACINKEMYHHGDTESFVESEALTEAYGTTGQIVHHDH